MKNIIILILCSFILIILINPILTELLSVYLKINRTEKNTKVIGKNFIPDFVYINGNNSQITSDGKINLEKDGIYNVTMQWKTKKKLYDKLFNDIYSVLEIDLSNFDTSGVTSMKSMFKGCKYLKYINFKNFDTSNVKSMASMFEECYSLESLDLSSFNTLNLEEMTEMFKSCYSLVSINLSNFITTKVKKINELFYNCYNLSEVVISNFDTNKVTTMGSLFYGCKSLTSINLSNFNTIKVKIMKEMFYSCSSLTSLDLSNFVTSSVTDMSFMFYDCESLISLNLSNFITTKVSNMNSMFSECSSLKYIDLSSFDIKNVANMNNMFKECTSLLSLDLSSFDFSKKNLDSFFEGCTSLTSINFPNNNQLVKSIVSMFSRCHSLVSLDLSNFNFSQINNMNYLFYECKTLTSLDLSKTETHSVTNIERMFENCISLECLNLTNFTTSTITNISSLFKNCRSLKSLDLNGFNTSKVNDMSYLFLDCYKLESVNLSSFDTSLVTNMYLMFYGCNSLKSLDLSNFNTSLITTMEKMFYSCNSLESLDLSSFNTSLITTMEKMFYSCKSLESLDLSNFDTSLVTNMENMFCSCSSLTSLDLSNFKTTKLLRASYMFSICSNLKYINFYNLEDKPIALSYIFNETPDNLIVCTNKKCTEKLMFQLSPNQCIINNCLINLQYDKLKHIYNKKICLDTCFSEQKYKYEFKDYCYDKCPKGTYPMENNTNYCDYYEFECFEDYPFLIIEDNSCSEECNCKDFFNDICKINNNNIKSQSILISNIIKGIEDRLIDELILETFNEENDIIKIENNTLYQITSSFNQNNKNYQNISSIDLSECENYLKGKYDILENETLIIFKTEKYLDEILIPIIEFEVFNPKTKEKLNLNYCKNLSINYIIYIPVFINESNLYKHEQNSSYYNDICYTYTTENGTDITLYDRQKEFNDKNLSLCPLSCTYNGYDQINKKSICFCEFQERILFSDINSEQLVHNFSIIKRETNFYILKCYKLLFLDEGLVKNSGSYIIILIIILYIVSGIYFYLKGYDIICNQINDILNSNILDNYIINEKFDIKFIKDNLKENKLSSNFSAVKKGRNLFKKNNISRESVDSKIDSDFMFNRNIKIGKINQLTKKENIKKLEYVDYEINTVQYNEALKNDQRTYLMYYLSVIKKKHLLISAFIPNKDYNAYVIKICLPFFSFVLCLLINALFFNDTALHVIYIDKGRYNFKYFLPKIIYSLIISSIVIVIIKRLFLTQQNILEIKNEENKYKLKGKVLIVLKCIIIKFICFFVFSIFFLILFWYYLSCFCAVYKNTQRYLFKNTFISYLISLIYPFVLWVIPGIFRIPALKGAGECFYKISQIIQIF